MTSNRHAYQRNQPWAPVLTYRAWACRRSRALRWMPWLAILLAGLVASDLRAEAQGVVDPLPLPGLFTPQASILFQGDSITDGNRGRSADPNHILGHGYQFIIAARFAELHPEQHLTFSNRGVSGNRVADLAKRWQADTLELKPDVLSILIGINDFSHAPAGADQGPAEAYERDYDALLTTTLAALPGVRLVLGEPFLLPSGSLKDRYVERLAALKSYQDAVDRLGRKFHAPVIHYQRMFTAACQKAPADYWIWDGVHPTYAGHGLMADEWIRTVQADDAARVKP